MAIALFAGTCLSRAIRFTFVSAPKVRPLVAKAVPMFHEALRKHHA
jgi:hypothetical protein